MTFKQLMLILIPDNEQEIVKYYGRIVVSVFLISLFIAVLYRKTRVFVENLELKFKFNYLPEEERFDH